MKRFVFFKIFCVMLIVTLLAAAAGCGEQNTSVTEGDKMLSLSLDELSAFDGKDGQPAYIAIDGVIYDVTSVPQWANGDHNGFTAGNDLTEEIKNISPHGVSKLKGLPVVGELEE